MTRQEQEDQAQLEWLQKWKERRKEKRNVRKKPLFYKILRKLGIIKDYEEDIRTRMEMCERAIKANVCPEDCDICAWDTLESCRDPAEPKRTLYCYGRTST